MPQMLSWRAFPIDLRDIKIMKQEECLDSLLKGFGASCGFCILPSKSINCPGNQHQERLNFILLNIFDPFARHLQKWANNEFGEPAKTFRTIEIAPQKIFLCEIIRSLTFTLRSIRLHCRHFFIVSSNL
jgi:hypothetical protein